MSATCTVLRPGPLTTVQDWPGRVGYWKIGVPPSGPMDDLSFRLANLAVGNDEGTAGLEATMAGPRLRFDAETTVAVTGAAATVTVDGRPVPQWTPVTVPAGGVLDVGAVTGAGLRVYIAVAGGIDVDPYLGSGATFTLGKFGGVSGRVLADGDALPLGTSTGTPRRLTAEEIPAIGHDWTIAVTEGPHGAPEFFTRAGDRRELPTSYVEAIRAAVAGANCLSCRHRHFVREPPPCEAPPDEKRGETDEFSGEYSTREVGRDGECAAIQEHHRRGPPD